eukprot:TRINITY_DN4135_c0_g1_i1.p1 TRINITY_DN4135_c0_g1~~TRINITY_DN4135_c0_g1_i1.p1  ORF type:complete len:489 (-),score=111.29 TRINITY_DN4135_c0_g1_i1:210-1676(-)
MSSGHSEAEKLKEIGNKKFQSGDYDEAIVNYSKAIDLSPSAIYYANRAACYAAQNLIDKSLQDCNKAIELDGTYAKGYFRRGSAYFALGKLMEAEMDFNKVIQLEPKNEQSKTQIKTINRIRSLLERGSKCLQDQDWPEALSAYKEILATCTCSHEAKLGVAEALLGIKNYQEAKQIATAILQSDDEDTHALLIRGLALYYMGELSSSTKLFSNILQLDPDNSKANKYRKLSRQIETLKEEGNKEFRDGRHEIALKHWTDAIDLDHSLTSVNKILYANKGAALKSLGKYEEAVEALSKSIELDGDYLKAYVRRAQCYMELKKYEEAERDYLLANSKEPNDKEIKRGLAEAKKLRKIACRKDYYKILGVDKDFNEHQLSKAYKKRCLETHPDRQPEEKRKEAEVEFKNVQEAYDVLKDHRKRQAYDAGADLEEINGGGPGFGGFGGFGGEGVDISDLFGAFGGGGGGVRFSTGGGAGGFPGGFHRHHGF